MNHHAAIDVGTLRLSALFLRDAKFFARTVDSEPLVDVAADATVDVGDPTTAGVHEVTVDTPLGAFDAAYLPWQWIGSDAPTLIYHHGSGERPFDFGRFSSNSFRRLFVGHDEQVPANVIAVRAPFHAGSNTEYARAMGDLENFVGMLAASAGLVEALAARVGDRSAQPVLASGISLGGFATNVHRVCFDHVDAYIPIFAGAALADLFVASAYRALTAESARRQSAKLRDALDFVDSFTAVDDTDCYPLLARHDRIVALDRQRPSYDGLSLSVLNKGHVTGSLATGALREHVVDVLSAHDDRN
ncbi:hypothetical protein SAMN04487948_101151 [Halogranum amylolyticum]|uniref:Alpha/beta hydrolase family protein n=1 Tax=Halogranum amylolyticum TaxID=660520 RepID=A0A1H8MX75_9EURY|nr:hypothetical protein [Halogranum amylolyticum]SEO21848.1 hypothetical protein SAMN04487948_101151 [Halogranum amylolyticum]